MLKIVQISLSLLIRLYPSSALQHSLNSSVNTRNLFILRELGRGPITPHLSCRNEEKEGKKLRTDCGQITQAQRWSVVADKNLQDGFWKLQTHGACKLRDSQNLRHHIGLKPKL